MLTISLRDLHRNTGKFTHMAMKEPIVVTERNKPVATLGPYRPPEKRASFRDFFTPERVAKMPKLKGQPVSDAISEDRNDRF